MMHALIFGAGSGLGKSLAEVYEKNGYEVVRVTRRECDLSLESSISQFMETLLQTKKPFTVCIFAAGVCHAGPLASLPYEAFANSFQVNFLAPISIFDRLRNEKLCGRFIFVLSGAGDLLMPGLAPYSLSKRALRDFLYFANLERSMPDVKLLAIRPGPIATDFNQKASLYGNYVLPKNRKARSPEEIALRIFRADQSGKHSWSASHLPYWLGKLQTFFGGITNALLRVRNK